MIKKILVTICAAILGSSLCMAQSNGSQAITNWGVSVHDVQLSIALSNNVIAADSIITLFVKVKNSSTNDISLADDLTISLINESGEVYMLKRPALFHLERLVENIKSGEIRDWMIPLTISKKIESGDYTLKATRSFGANKNNYELVSSMLKVQIK